jgi:O-antigen/teichoic acid export membrane protein
LNLLTNLLRTLAAAGMLLFLHRTTAWNWALASAVVSGFAAIIAVITASSYFGKPELKPELFIKHGLEGIGYSFAASTSSAYNDLDKTMLSHYGMNIANGIYTMAYRIVDIATIPIFSVRDAALPRLFQRGRSGIGPAAELSYRLLKRAFGLSIILAVGMFVVAPLIPRVVGPGFAESVVALRWLCLIPVFRSIHQMTGSALTGAGLQRYRTVAQLVAAGQNFCLNLWLIPHYSWRGAAYASLATDATLGIMNWAILRALTSKVTVVESLTT